MTSNSLKYFCDVFHLKGSQVKQLSDYVLTLEKITDKHNVMDQFVERQHKQWQTALHHIGVQENDDAKSILHALQKEVEYLNMELLHSFHFPDLSEVEGWDHLMTRCMHVMEPEDLSGYFVKYEVAEQLLRKRPPKEIIDYFGYADIDELLKNIDIREVYAALRFGVSEEWNNTFLQLYGQLTPTDFEERKIDLLVLDAKRWFELARDFAESKLHPFSHLKEMGVVFVIPNPKGTRERDLLKIMITLALHYLYEVGFYARYFKSLSERNPDTFGTILQNIIRGDIIAKDVPPEGVRITHKYYTKKKNPNPLAFEPHVIPEPLHWHNGRRLLKKVLCGQAHEHSHCVIDFWDTCYTVAKRVDDTLISLNFADNVVSNAEHESYHVYEDLWNAIFIEFFSREELESALLKRLEEGYINLNDIASE